MTEGRNLVEVFYGEVWNRADEGRARDILASDFRFRSSLGAEKVGPEGFIAYMRDVHRGLGDYTCIIDDLLVEGARAAARMRFTGRQVTWAGAAFFEFRDGRIAALWVLGNLIELKRQLEA